MKSIALDYTPIALRHSGRTYKTGVFRYAKELTSHLLDQNEYSISITHPHLPYTSPYDLYHSLFHLFPPIKQKNSPKTQLVTTVHDLIAWIYPELYPAHAIDLKRVKQSMQGQWIIAPSESTKKDLTHFCNCNPDHIFVTPLAADTSHFYPQNKLGVLEKYGLKNTPYFLYVGRLEERKNVHKLIDSFYELVTQQKIESIKLVLCGPRVTRYPDLDWTLSKYCSDKNFFKSIIHIPFIDEKELPTLYSQSLAFIFLSKYEGFGLPILEAMSCGTLPICFNNSSLPEVMGKEGFLISNNDFEDIKEKMLWVYANQYKLSAYEKKAIQQAQTFSWKKTTQLTQLAYQKILN